MEAIRIQSDRNAPLCFPVTLSLVRSAHFSCCQIDRGGRTEQTHQVLVERLSRGSGRYDCYGKGNWVTSHSIRW